MNVSFNPRAWALVCAASLLIAGTAWSDNDEDIQGMGAGMYLLTTSGGTEIPVKFSFHAKQKNGTTKGRFRQELVFGGLPIDFHGEVTCLSVDPVNGRMWVGGIVTKNDSVHPGFTTEIHEPGKDVWFRVLDTGKHSAEADRSTFLGFEGGGDIITSEEYCELQIWPDGNERTHPVTHGKIKLKLDDD